MFQRTLFAAALTAAAVLPAFAHHDGDVTQASGIVVSHAHTVEVGATAHSMDVFFTIENTSDQPVTLTGASVEFAADGIFQAPSVNESGTLSVREVKALEIAPGQTLTLQPNGVHVVFHDVQRRVQAGDHFHADLEFKDIGTLEVEVEVEAADHDHGDHDETS